MGIQGCGILSAYIAAGEFSGLSPLFPFCRSGETNFDYVLNIPKLAEKNP